MEMDEGGSHVSQIMFFCGHKVFCTTVNGEEAFKYVNVNERIKLKLRCFT